MKSEMSKGICLECGEPLVNPNSYGYHTFCFRQVFKEEGTNQKEQGEKPHCDNCDSAHVRKHENGLWHCYKCGTDFNWNPPKKEVEQWHPINFAGHWRLYDEPFYEANDLMDSDDVGEEQAQKNAELAAMAPVIQSALASTEQKLRDAENDLKAVCNTSKLLGEKIQIQKERIEELERELNNSGDKSFRQRWGSDDNVG